MTDTLPNIDIPRNDWVDLYALSSIPVGAAVSVQNVGTCDIYIAIQEDKPLVTSDSFRILQRINGLPFIAPAGSSGLWAFCNTTQGKVNIRVDNVPEADQKTAYGELLTASLAPEIQISAEYNTTGQVDQIATGTSTTGATGGEFFGTVGTGPNDVAAIFSKDQIIPRHGQGVLFRYSTRFPVGLANSRVVGGGGTASDAVAFGYEGVEFGVFYTHGGAVVIYELQITGAATGSEDATVTINGTGYTVPLTAGTVNHNAFEIAESLNSQVALFNFSQVDDTVVIRSVFAAPEAGAFTFSSATATGVFTQISEGIIPTRNFTSRSNWSEGDKVDLNPEKTNYYTIRYNGDIEYYVQDETTGDDFLVHQQSLPNTLDGPIFGNSSFRMVWSISNFGNTTPMTISAGHGAAFIEGIIKVRFPSLSTGNEELSISDTLTNILTIRNREVFGSKVNLGRFIPISVSAFSTGTKGTVLEVLCNATFDGETDFSYHNKDESIVEIDTSTNAVLGGDVLATKVFVTDTEIPLKFFNDVIQPGKALTIAMRVVQVPDEDVGAAVSWEEEF